PLRVQSSADDDILEMEAAFEGETTLDGEKDPEHDTERVMLLEADAIKTEPVAKMDPETPEPAPPKLDDDEEDDKETIRVEKLARGEAHPPGTGVVSSPPPPAPRPPRPTPVPLFPPPPPVQHEVHPAPVIEHLPKIQILELPVLRAPSPPRGAPVAPL